jgi:hypothetical protein
LIILKDIQQAVIYQNSARVLNETSINVVIQPLYIQKRISSCKGDVSFTRLDPHSKRVLDTVIQYNRSFSLKT